MSDLPVPASPDETPSSGAEHSGNSSEPQQQASSKSQIPSADRCLENIARVAGCVGAGILSPGQGNAMRSCYDNILKDRRENQSGERGRFSDATISKLAGLDPQVLNLLEPFLTDDQIANLMQARKGKHGQA